jgi:ATP-binding cassette, subfamily B, multidrug efflux pump
MKALRHLNKYFWKYKWHLFSGIIFVIAQNFGAIYPAQVVRKALDDVMLSLNSIPSNAPEATVEMLKSDIGRTVGYFLLIIVAVAIIRGLLMFLMRQTIIVMSRRIEYDLKNEIFNHYQLLNLAFYRRNNTGDLMNRISEDVGRVRMYIGPAIMYTVNLAILFILITVSMLYVNVKLTLYVLAPLPFLSISIYYVSDLMNKKSEDVQIQQSRLSTFVQEAFSGIRILKSFVKEDASAKEFEKQSEIYKEKNISLAKVNAFFFPLMLLLVGLSTLLVVYIGGREVIAGRATTGNIAEFIIYVNMLTWPVASLGWVTSIIQRAAASQVRINEFLHLEPEIKSNSKSEKNISGKIEFRNVSFVYPDSGIKALDNVSFSIESGESLAVLGHTGSGKSTIANLLVRMYDVTKGKIYIDDTPLEDFPLESLRRHSGYVPQDVFLFSDTIANNISFGLADDIDPVKRNKLVLEAAKESVIYDNIIEFPKQFETMVGERGITLSGGQKQRISIARAIIRRPQLLIFDDCLSAVDTNTEKNILDNLELIMKGRTSVIISHRVSSVRNADKIIVLENGRIVEEGNHFSLMEKRGEYFELYEKQMLEQMNNE